MTHTPYAVAVPDAEIAFADQDEPAARWSYLAATGRDPGNLGADSVKRTRQSPESRSRKEQISAG